MNETGFFQFRCLQQSHEYYRVRLEPVSVGDQVDFLGSSKQSCKTKKSLSSDGSMMLL